MPTELRMRERIIFRLHAGAGSPDKIPGFFVEAIESVGRRALRSPIGRNTARNYEISINSRRGGAPIRKSQSAKFLHERVSPQELTVGCESGQDALRPLHVHITGFSINCRARRCVPKINGIAQVIVIQMLPDFFSALGVKTSNSFLQVGALALISHGV